MRAIFLCLALAACGDNKERSSPDAAADAAPPVDGAAGLASCLDRPSQMVIPAATQLPCDLLPPGFKQ